MVSYGSCIVSATMYCNTHWIVVKTYCYTPTKNCTEGIPWRKRYFHLFFFKKDPKATPPQVCVRNRLVSKVSICESNSGRLEMLQLYTIIFVSIETTRPNTCLPEYLQIRQRWQQDRDRDHLDFAMFLLMKRHGQKTKNSVHTQPLFHTFFLEDPELTYSSLTYSLFAAHLPSAAVWMLHLQRQGQWIVFAKTADTKCLLLVTEKLIFHFICSLDFHTFVQFGLN